MFKLVKWATGAMMERPPFNSLFPTITDFRENYPKSHQKTQPKLNSKTQTHFTCLLRATQVLSMKSSNTWPIDKFQPASYLAKQRIVPRNGLIGDSKYQTNQNPSAACSSSHGAGFQNETDSMIHWKFVFYQFVACGLFLRTPRFEFIQI